MASLIHFTLCFTWVLVFVVSGSTEPCNRGFWGERCENKCNKRCRCDYGCDKLTGKCSSCDYGYWGFYCTEKCPSTCQEACSTYPRWIGFGCINSLDCGTQCSRISGKCSSCPDGFWGDYCHKICLSLERCQRCQISNGSSCYQCKPHFWGTVCENECPPNCERCIKSSGSCYYYHYGCNKGYYGTYCGNRCYTPNCVKCSNYSFCEECEAGYWGPSCSSCNITRCDRCNQVSGRCEKCKDGYWGERCEFECTSHCAGVQCDVRTGMCFTCKADIWGDFCNNTCTLDHCSSFGECTKRDGPVCYQCDPGRWGNICEFECSTNCSNGCKKSTGECYVFEHDFDSSLKTTVQEKQSTEITSTDHSSVRQDKTSFQISERTIIGISIGSSLSVSIIFIVAVVLLFVFCYTRMKEKFEEKIISKNDGISFDKGERKATLKGLDYSVGLQAQNNLYEIPARALVTTGNTPASDNDMPQEQLYANCCINSV